MRLRERRVLLGMTQKHFAEAIGTTPQQVSKYEAGRGRVAAGVLYRIAQALDVDVGYFFQGLSRTVDPNDRSRIWIALTRDVMRISNPRQRRALLRLALLMAGTDWDNDSDQGQDDG